MSYHEVEGQATFLSVSETIFCKGTDFVNTTLNRARLLNQMSLKRHNCHIAQLRGCQTPAQTRSGDNPFSEMHTCFSQGISPFKSSLEQLPILGFNVDFIGISGIFCGSNCCCTTGGCFQMLHTFHDMSSFLGGKP